MATTETQFTPDEVIGGTENGTEIFSTAEQSPSNTEANVTDSENISAPEEPKEDETTSVPLSDHITEVIAAYGGTEDDWTKYAFTAYPHEDGNHYFFPDLATREFPLNMSESYKEADSVLYVMFYEPGPNGQIISYTYAREIPAPDKEEKDQAKEMQEETKEQELEASTVLDITALLGAEKNSATAHSEVPGFSFELFNFSAAVPEQFSISVIPNLHEATTVPHQSSEVVPSPVFSSGFSENRYGDTASSLPYSESSNTLPNLPTRSGINDKNISLTGTLASPETNTIFSITTHALTPEASASTRTSESITGTLTEPVSMSSKRVSPERKKSEDSQSEQQAPAIPAHKSVDVVSAPRVITTPPAAFEVHGITISTRAETGPPEAFNDHLVQPEDSSEISPIPRVQPLVVQARLSPAHRSAPETSSAITPEAPSPEPMQDQANSVTLQHPLRGVKALDASESSTASSFDITGPYTGNTPSDHEQTGPTPIADNTPAAARTASRNSSPRDSVFSPADLKPEFDPVDTSEPSDETPGAVIQKSITDSFYTNQGPEVGNPDVHTDNGDNPSGPFTSGKPISSPNRTVDHMFTPTSHGSVPNSKPPVAPRAPQFPNHEPDIASHTPDTTPSTDNDSPAVQAHIKTILFQSAPGTLPATPRTPTHTPASAPPFTPPAVHQLPARKAGMAAKRETAPTAPDDVPRPTIIKPSVAPQVHDAQKHLQDSDAAALPKIPSINPLRRDYNSIPITTRKSSLQEIQDKKPADVQEPIPTSAGASMNHTGSERITLVRNKSHIQQDTTGAVSVPVSDTTQVVSLAA